MSKNNLLEINDLHVNVEDKEILHGVNLSAKMLSVSGLTMRKAFICFYVTISQTAM